MKRLLNLEQTSDGFRAWIHEGPWSARGRYYHLNFTGHTKTEVIKKLRELGVVCPNGVFRTYTPCPYEDIKKVILERKNSKKETAAQNRVA